MIEYITTTSNKYEKYVYTAIGVSFFCHNVKNTKKCL